MSMDTIKDLVLREARKASAAFLSTLAGSLGTAMLDGNITGTEGVASLGAALLATATVYGFGNKDKLKK